MKINNKSISIAFVIILAATVIISLAGMLLMYNPQIEMFARFKMKSSFHKTKRII